MNSSNENMLQSLHQYSLEIVVMKDGEAGSYVLLNGRWIHIPRFPVLKVVNTFGAGVRFDTGFLYSILQKLPIEKSLTFANAIGVVVWVYGDKEGLPYLEEVERFLGIREMVER